MTDDDNKKVPEWPKTRTTILDVCRGKQVIGKRVIVETCRYGKRWGASHVASTEQITHSKLDLLEEVEHHCIEELTHAIEG